MADFWKIISQADDSSKRFQMRCLRYWKTLDERSWKWIDVETMYYSKDMDLDWNILSENNKYYVFEYLKDECPYITKEDIWPLNWDIFPEKDAVPKYFSPRKSDPNRYQRNWRKFHALFCLAKRLNWELVLVNYSDWILVGDNGEKIKAPEWFDKQVRVMIVDNVDKDLVSKNLKTKTRNDYITYKETKCMTVENYARRLIKMNQNCTLPEII